MAVFLSYGPITKCLNMVIYIIVRGLKVFRRQYIFAEKLCFGTKSNF